MIQLTNNLYKLKNVDTGDIFYVMTPTHFCNITGMSQAQRYSFLSKGKWRNWTIEQIDGTDIKWGQIYKNPNRGT